MLDIFNPEHYREFEGDLIPTRVKQIEKQRETEIERKKQRQMEYERKMEEQRAHEREMLRRKRMHKEKSAQNIGKSYLNFRVKNSANSCSQNLNTFEHSR